MTTQADAATNEQTASQPNPPPAGVPPAEWHKAALEEYKLYVDSLEKLVARRLTLNAFFISINTILLAGMAVTSKAREVLSLGITIGAALIMAGAGVAISRVWASLLGTYKQLSTAKFKVIHILESRLPERPFALEDEILGEMKYSSSAQTEIDLPKIFKYLYGLLFVCILIFTILSVTTGFGLVKEDAVKPAASTASSAIGSASVVHQPPASPAPSSTVAPVPDLSPSGQAPPARSSDGGK